MSMKLELSLYATGLKNVAGAFKGTSDPYAVVTKLATNPGDKPVVLGKTEVIKNTLSPNWVKVFLLDYDLGSTTKVAVNLFDEVRKGEHKSMGSAVFDIAELLGARGNTKAKKLKNGGTIFALVRKSLGTGVFRLKMKGIKLKNVEGMFSKSDPFFELLRKVDTAGGITWDNVYRSKEMHNNLDPDWEAAVIDLSTLCGGNLDCPIQVQVYDFESTGKHTPMGQFESSVNGLVRAAQSGSSIPLLKKGKESGKIQIQKAEVSGVEQITNQMAATSVTNTRLPVGAPVPSPAVAAPFVAAAVPMGVKPSFIDYVSGGCELNVVVAIDFTGSNGDPRRPGTLHYINHGGDRNDYERAIAAIVSILAKYDSDQKFPVLGFGARYGQVVRHCFQCGPSQEAQGVMGVLDAYHQVFKSGLVMSGPTVFNEVIETAAARAQSSFDASRSRGQQSYTILLILTDGAVSDAGDTARCLNRVSNAPLSVVIVGVGNDDFSSMQYLDDAGGAKQRDIVQFVQFNRFSQNSEQLTRETLNEIPDQLVGYFHSRGIAPLPPVQRSSSSIVVENEDAEIDLSLDIKDDEIVVTSGGDDFVNGFNATK